MNPQCSRDEQNERPSSTLTNHIENVHFTVAIVFQVSNNIRDASLLKLGTRAIMETRIDNSAGTLRVSTRPVGFVPNAPRISRNARCCEMVDNHCVNTITYDSVMKL